MNVAAAGPGADSAARPAGFWQRAAAWSIDAAVVAPLALLLAWPWLQAPARTWITQVDALLRLSGRVVGEAVSDGAMAPNLAATLLDTPALRAAIAAADAATWSLAWPALLAYALLGAGYHVAGECSPWQGGIGKRLLGLQACDRHGRGLGLGRALLRYLAASLSWATLNIGHWMAALPPRHLALHDRCSGSRVVARDRTLPRWAWWWLVFVGLANLVVAIKLSGAAVAMLRHGLGHAWY